MARLVKLFVLALLLLPNALDAQQAPRPGSGGNPIDPDAARPIDALESVWIEELTFMEVRDAIRAGNTTVLVPTGGVEENGPYLAGGKHNYILQQTAEAIARKLGDALIAPIIKYVPEGEIDLEPGAIRYPGTIGVRVETFKSVLTDVSTALRANGFEHILLIGDSGGNQQPQLEVAEALSAKWTDGRTTIHHVPEYYNWVERQEWLRERGVNEVMQDPGLHDEFSATSIMMLTDPTTVRMEQRIRAGHFSINGVDLAPIPRTLTLGRELVDWIADVSVEAIHEAIGASDRN